MFKYLLSINTIIVVSTSLAITSGSLINHLKVNREDLIYINEGLKSQNLGFLQTQEQALEAVEFILLTLAPTYEVIVDNSYPGVVIVNGNEILGYTGTVNYYYDMPTDIRDKLPGAYLGVFTTQNLAKKRMDELIEKSNYSVLINYSQKDTFIVYGNTQDQYIGQSFYTYNLLPNIDITEKLPGAYLGFFQTKEAARARMDDLIAKTGYSIIVDDQNENQFIINGNEAEGYEGSSIYTYELY